MIRFATYTPNNPGTAYMRVLQSSSDPENAETSATTIGTFHVRFDGGPWYLVTSNGDGNNNVINGAFNCFTGTGF